MKYCMEKLTDQKRAERIIEMYKHSHITTLEQAYTTTYSVEKFWAFKRCKRLQKKKQGTKARVIWYRPQVFTYGFVYRQNKKVYLAYITPEHDYAIDITNRKDLVTR